MLWPDTISTCLAQVSRYDADMPTSSPTTAKSSSPRARKSSGKPKPGRRDQAGRSDRPTRLSDAELAECRDAYESEGYSTFAEWSRVTLLARARQINAARHATAESTK